MKVILGFAIIVGLCGVAAAQERVTRSQTTPDPMFERMGKDPSVYSRSITGKILAIDSSRGLLMIEAADQRQLTFTVDGKARLVADKDTVMGTRKDLSLSDYAPGQLVRVSYRVSDSKALAIRLKRPRT